MNLSDNFTLEEFTYSSTAEQRGINNNIHDPETVIPNARALCQKVLQKVRDHFGPIVISSGYSNSQLCLALGRKTTSQHALGQAADIISNSVSNYDLAVWIRDHLEFDQLIYEVRRRGLSKEYYDWVHVSYKREGRNRKEVLFSPPEKGYKTGLPETSYV